jgi:hypothetical protein
MPLYLAQKHVLDAASMAKLYIWCGIEAIYALKAAPVLDFN